MVLRFRAYGYMGSPLPKKGSLTPTQSMGQRRSSFDLGLRAGCLRLLPTQVFVQSYSYSENVPKQIAHPMLIMHHDF